MYCDIAIIGASIAGSIAAQLLGRQGVSVALYEAKRFPRAKACGEGLSAYGVEALRRLQIARQATTFPLHGFAVYDAAGAQIFSSQESTPPVYGVRREEFDYLLLNEACALPTVTIHEGVQIKRISTSAASSQRFTICGHGGEVIGLARYIIIACGGAAHLIQTIPHHTHALMKPRKGVSVRWSGDEPHHLPPQVQLYLKEGRQIFITPSSETAVNVSALASGGIHYSLKEFSEDIKHLSQKFSLDEKEYGEVIGCAAVSAGRTIAADGHGAFLVGDACERFDPVGGMGMTHAILSAEAVTASLLSVLRNELSLSHASLHYTTTREAFARPLRGFSALLYGVLAAPKTFTFHRTRAVLLNSPLQRVINRAMHYPDATMSTRLTKRCMSYLGAQL